MIKERQYLCIAGLRLAVSSAVRLTANYGPFLVSSDGGEIARISVGTSEPDSGRPVQEGVSLEEGRLCVSRDAGRDGGYRASMHVGGRVFGLYASPRWDEVVLSAGCAGADCPPAVVDTFMMLAFIYSSARYRTVLLHASCVRSGLHSAAFIGPSGAGKSTHSRLWLEHVPGAVLLNDDQPAVRLDGRDGVTVYGTPWSGKTPCYRAEQASLEGIIRMEKAGTDRIVRLEPLALFQALLASCSMMRWDAETFHLIASTLAGIASRVPGHVLENRADREAALLAYGAVSGNGR